MRTIRRFYFYLVAFISLEVVIWGLIHLLRTILKDSLFPGTETLAQGLALILVGLPIFALHWLWPQRAAEHDDEERSATLRAIFLYLTLLSTLIPVAQNGLALLDRLLLSAAGLDASRAILGSTQTWQDNLIAIALNGVAAAYFFTVLRADWQLLTEHEDFGGVRRLYRYAWVLYGLAMTVFGIQQTLSFLLDSPGAIIGESVREVLINGIALMIVGAPIWACMWTVCQKALDQPTEQDSILRLAVLYLLALAAVVTVLTSSAIVVDTLLRLALGENMSFREFILQIKNPLSIGLPLAGIWAYYGTWLGKDIRSVSDAPRQAGLNRLYFYILSLIGLGATFVGLALVLSFVVDTLIGSSALWGESLRPRLAGAIATLLVSLPLWLLTWNPMQTEALATGDAGDHARRSLVRKVYLYLVIFATVIGGMTSGVYLVYQLLNAFLSGTRPDNFVSDVLNSLQVLILFIAFLLYHFSALRRDGGQAANSLAARYGRFPVLVFENEGSGFAALVDLAIQKTAPGIPVAVQALERGIPPEANNTQAVVLSSALALNPPEALRLWLKEYAGQKIIVPVKEEGWFWPGGTPRNAEALAAQIIRQLADGQEVRPSAGPSVLQVVLIVVGIFFFLSFILPIIIFLIALFASR